MRHHAVELNKAQGQVYHLTEVSLVCLQLGEAFSLCCLLQEKSLTAANNNAIGRSASCIPH
jgi:hypothetical protein